MEGKMRGIGEKEEDEWMDNRQQITDTEIESRKTEM